MRSSHIWRHSTVVTGDPQWENYQVDVDVYNMVDVEQGHARANYRKFGPYGRVNVHNLPSTAGEHSFVAVAFGNFASYDFSYGTYDSQTFQIRAKYPEPLFVWRDHSRQLRLTKVLDFQPWPIPEKQKIHITAQYYGDYVAGFVNNEKVVEGRIPADHPGKQSGRIALWTFETWVEWASLYDLRRTRRRSAGCQTIQAAGGCRRRLDVRTLTVCYGPGDPCYGRQRYS